MATPCVLQRVHLSTALVIPQKVMHLVCLLIEALVAILHGSQSASFCRRDPCESWAQQFLVRISAV